MPARRPGLGALSRRTRYRRHKFGISLGSYFPNHALTPSQIASRKEAADDRGNDGPEREALPLLNVLAASRGP
jgi:hypothetical protein